jgi:hypothetical protein
LTLYEPGTAVDEFSHCVEVACVASGLSDHMKEDGAQILELPVRPELIWPHGGRLIEGSAGDNGVRELDLLPVGVEHGLGRNVRGDLPCGGIGVLGCRELDRLTGDDPAEPEPLVFKRVVPDSVNRARRAGLPMLLREVCFLEGCSGSPRPGL